MNLFNCTQDRRTWMTALRRRRKARQIRERIESMIVGPTRPELHTNPLKLLVDSFNGIPYLRSKAYKRFSPYFNEYSPASTSFVALQIVLSPHLLYTSTACLCRHIRAYREKLILHLQPLGKQGPRETRTCITGRIFWGFVERPNSCTGWMG